jgi:acetyl-CoA C-acetyltransferase
LNILGAKLVYSVVGGDQPQALVNEAAEDIFAGKAKMVLLAGSEATGAMRAALKAGMTLDWSQPAEGAFEDRGLGPMLLSDYERKNGLGVPTQTYPAFEHALRRRLGLSRDQHLDLMSELWAGFSAVAEQNPYAQFGTARSKDYLATPSRDNYQVADPYLKWHVAQDAVNQGAAVIMTSVGKALELGVDPKTWIFLHGYAAVKDRLVTHRPDLSRSLAIELALSAALQASGKQAADVALFDLYSCFPCAVLLAAEALETTIPCTPSPAWSSAFASLKTSSASFSPMAGSCPRRRLASIRQRRLRNGVPCRAPLFNRRSTRGRRRRCWLKRGPMRSKPTL